MFLARIVVVAALAVAASAPASALVGHLGPIAGSVLRAAEAVMWSPAGFPVVAPIPGL